LPFGNTLLFPALTHQLLLLLGKEYLHRAGFSCLSKW
jgi:hypothetical protein